MLIMTCTDRNQPLLLVTKHYFFCNHEQHFWKPGEHYRMVRGCFQYHRSNQWTPSGHHVDRKYQGNAKSFYHIYSKLIKHIYDRYCQQKKKKEKSLDLKIKTINTSLFLNNNLRPSSLWANKYIVNYNLSHYLNNNALNWWLRLKNCQLIEL